MVDARMIDASGIGTYLRNTLSRVVARRADWRFTLIGSTSALRRDDLADGDNIQVIKSRAPIYGAREQIVFARLARAPADLFWSPHYNIPLAASAPIVATIHDVMHLSLPEYAGFARRAYSRTMFGALRRNAAAIICVSEFTRRELSRFIGETTQTTVVPNGVDDTWRSVERPVADRPYIVFVGLAKPHKNLRTLLCAFETVSDRIPHDLVIVTPRVDGLRTSDDGPLARAAALAPRVRVRENLSLSELQACVAGADFLVQPSTYEGFGLPPLEAMAAGTPCLVARIGALEEVCADAAEYCDPHDASDVADKIVHLAKDAAGRDALRRRGRERAGAYSWDRTADQTIAVFENVLTKGPHGR